MESQVKLDIKDKKILDFLIKDARMSNSSLAKAIGLSKKGIEYRINKLEEKGVIQNYNSIINYKLLGYSSINVYVNLQFLNKEIKKKIKYFLENSEIINFISWTNREYDLKFIALSKKFESFKKLFNDFNLKFSMNIKDTLFTVSISSDYNFYSFNNENANSPLLSISETEKKVELDNLDKKILTELNINARKNSSEIARITGSNYKVIGSRIKKMIKKNVILGMQAQINFSILGKYKHEIFLFLSEADKKTLKDMKLFLKKKEGVSCVHNQLGIADLNLELITDTNDGFYDFIDEFQDKYPNILKDYKHMIFIENIKTNFIY